MEEKELVKFTIPFLPISCNSLYGISSKRGRVQVFLKGEARSFKEKAKLFMPMRTVSPSYLFKLEIKVMAPWHTENGHVKKQDIQNLEKILIDAISEKYEFNDSRIWIKYCEKVESEKEEVEVRLSYLIESSI